MAINTHKTRINGSKTAHEITLERAFVETGTGDTEVLIADIEPAKSLIPVPKTDVKGLSWAPGIRPRGWTPRGLSWSPRPLPAPAVVR